MFARKRGEKYGAKKTTIDGIVFDSKVEGKRYEYLKMLEEQGMISNLELQPKFNLQEKFKRNDTSFRAIDYVADFRYNDKDGRIVVEDVKGMLNQVYLVKVKLLLRQLPEHIVFKEVYWKGKVWTEVIK